MLQAENNPLVENAKVYINPSFRMPCTPRVNVMITVFAYFSVFIRKH
jgi:hypothetical protein